MTCELCGKETQTFQTMLEGAYLSICQSCAGKPTARKVFKKIKKHVRPKQESNERIVSNYAQLIQKSRGDMNQKDFSKKLQIKESVLHKLEFGSFRPSVQLAYKMGRILNIRLVKKEEERKEVKLQKKSSISTMADVVKIKKRNFHG